MGDNLSGKCFDNPETSFANGISHVANFDGDNWIFSAADSRQVGYFSFRVVYETKGTFYPNNLALDQS